MPNLYGETVTLVARTVSGQDAYGKDIYTTTAETPVDNCGFAPAGSIERVQGQDVITTTPTAYLPTGTPTPSAVDQVKARGDLYDIDGKPQVFVNPLTGTAPGAVLRLKAVTG
jgi:hypothetical protein